MDLNKVWKGFLGIPIIPTIAAIALGYYLIIMPFLMSGGTTIPGMLVLVILSYYTRYIIKMIFNKKERGIVRKTNTRLEELRCIPNKNLEQQKEFLDLKYPKKNSKKKWNLSWIKVNGFLFTLTMYIIIFKIFKYMLFISNISISWLVAIIFMVLFPLLLNIILEKFGIAKSDISIWFRGGRKK